MEKRIFIPVGALAKWLEQDLVFLDAPTQILSLRDQHFQLKEVYLVTSVEGGGQDEIGLVGRVVAPKELAALRAERLGNSMLIGDVGYTLEAGFLAEPIVYLELEGILELTRPAKAFPVPAVTRRDQSSRADITGSYYPIRKAG